MRIATYHRVSTVDQNADAARSELRAFAERMGGTLVLEVEEVGSGARNDRPGLKKVMEACRRRCVDALVIWKLDRLGRSTLDLHTNAALLEAYGVRLACVTQALDTGTPAGKLLFTVLAAVAEFERDVIRERTRMGLAAAKRRGKLLGRRRVSLPPLGAVAALKAKGYGCARVARELGCTTRAARLALAAVKASA
jgi:DNA invertase Pin-like site-specific DNA recombinase